MDSDDDVLLSSSPAGASPPVRQRKLKRLKKAIRVSSDEGIETSEIEGSATEARSSELKPPEIDELPTPLRFRESEERLPTSSGSEEFDGGNDLDSGFSGLVGDEDGSGAKRALDFDSFLREFDEDRSKETGEENADVRMEEPEEVRRSPDRLEEAKGEKKKEKRKKMVDDDEKIREKPSNKRRLEKEMQENLKQLLAESQKLLRETRDATFKPVPLVQKPISSVLEKIRKRKLEISKKSASNSRLSSFNDYVECSREVSVNQNIEPATGNESRDARVQEASNTDTITSPIEGDPHIERPCEDESNDGVTPSREHCPQMDIDEESKQEFRAPIDDTQDLFSDSQTSDSKIETPSSPLEEVFAPSTVPLNLQLDSAPPDDASSDEEEYDKENIDPCPRGLADLSLSPTGDPVRAFVDDEAEEDDDSDNDLLRFKENEEDEVEDDIEELRDMIATGYEEKPIDNDKRNALHQKWLEQQDEAGTENLLQKLKYGSKVREPTLIAEEEDEEEDQEGEEHDEFDDEGEEDLAPSNLVKMNLRKVKQMMPQMFTEDSDGYLSSEDEETEKKLTKQYLLEKAEEQVTFFSPAEDESSREVFGRIKKLNNAPDSKKRAKPQTYFDMSLMGVTRSISSKPSFLGRGSSGSASSSKKQGSTVVRSFIFEREDSNSKSATSVSTETSETVQIENRQRTVSAKFISSQTRTFTQNPAPIMNSDTSLLDILKRNSFASKRCTLNSDVVPQQTESMLSSFKLTKKPVKSREDRNF